MQINPNNLINSNLETNKSGKINGDSATKAKVLLNSGRSPSWGDQVTFAPRLATKLVKLSILPGS